MSEIAQGNEYVFRVSESFLLFTFLWLLIVAGVGLAAYEMGDRSVRMQAIEAGVATVEMQENGAWVFVWGPAKRIMVEPYDCVVNGGRPWRERRMDDELARN